MGETQTGAATVVGAGTVGAEAAARFATQAHVRGAGLVDADMDVEPVAGTDQEAIAALLLGLGIDQADLTAAELDLTSDTTTDRESFFRALLCEAIVTRLPGEDASAPSMILRNPDRAATVSQVVIPYRQFACRVAAAANAVQAAALRGEGWARLVAVDVASAWGLQLHMTPMQGYVAPAPA